MQMTIRGISKPLRQAMEERAKAEGKSLNQVAIESLEKSLDLAHVNGTAKRDLSYMAASPEDIKAMDEAEAMCERIDDWNETEKV